MTPKIIKTRKEYKAGLARVEELMGAESGPELDELELLSVLVEMYEDKHWPIESPTPAGAIRFRMDQLGISQAELAQRVGFPRSRISEILACKREPTMELVRRLHEHLGIPLESLIGKNSAQSSKRTAGKPKRAGAGIISGNPVGSPHGG